MFKGCEQEMVEDWWVMAGIMKPVVDKGKGVCLESWDLCKEENVDQGELTSNCIHNQLVLIVTIELQSLFV